MKDQLKNIWIVWDWHKDEDILRKGIKKRLMTKKK